MSYGERLLSELSMGPHELHSYIYILKSTEKEKRYRRDERCCSLNAHDVIGADGEATTSKIICISYMYYYYYIEDT